MLANTTRFGEIEVEDNKIIVFPGGIIGFPELTQFALIYDEEKGKDAGIKFMQSLQEPGFAMPVMDPLIVKPNYNPKVEEELLKSIGPVREEELLVVVTVTIPGDIKKMTVNLKGPIVINAEKCMACQVIVEGDEYKVKFPVYDILKAERGGV